ncbi:MAG: hypothetical protein NUW02_02820 [Candidatus Campbellbacteria bacterium]|nr:hypothetical protein [Candidatus Campbellbacteria bacterium]
MKNTNNNTIQKKKFPYFVLPTTSYYSRGFTLFYAMLISSLLLSIGLAIFNITYKEFILTSGVRESEGAFYAADSALECALYWDYVHDGSGAPAFGFYGDSLASGLVGYWRFEEVVDSNLDKAFDSSGQGNDGTLNDKITRTDGQIGLALPFDGVDDFFNTNNKLSLGTDNEHTISARVKVNGLPMVKGQNEWVLLLGDTGKGHQWLIDTDGILQVSGWEETPIATKPLGLGWNHVVVTYDGTSLAVYVNNESLGTTPANFVSLPAPQLTLGLPFVEGDAYFNGELDDVRVYNRELSSDEITALFSGTSNNMFVPPVASIEDDGIPLTCAGTIINETTIREDGTTGWVPAGGDGNWKIILGEEPLDESITFFDISFDDGTCALVEVTKRAIAVDNSSTEINSRGYNTCVPNSNRRLERALHATY